MFTCGFSLSENKFIQPQVGLGSSGFLNLQWKRVVDPGSRPTSRKPVLTLQKAGKKKKNPKSYLTAWSVFLQLRWNIEGERRRNYRSLFFLKSWLPIIQESLLFPLHLYLLRNMSLLCLLSHHLSLCLSSCSLYLLSLTFTICFK